MSAARRPGRRLAFVTNNASRTPNQVVLHLLGVGIAADESRGADLRPGRCPCPRRASCRPARRCSSSVATDSAPPSSPKAFGRSSAAADEPAGVVQGGSPGLDWPVLAEGAYALATGVPWVATNVDLTLPTSRGVAPGNGSFVRLLAGVSGREPDVVAGKPGPLMLLEAAGSDGRRALVVGDRLDTDIAGAVAADLDSLLVLTGVTDVPRPARGGSARAADVRLPRPRRAHRRATRTSTQVGDGRVGLRRSARRVRAMGC